MWKWPLNSVWRAVLLLAAACLFSPYSAWAKPAPPAKAADEPCRASLDSVQGFKDALLRHDIARQAFRTKFKTAWFAKPGTLSRELVSKTPEELVAATGKALENIAGKNTVLLLYDTGTERGQNKALCVWLMRADGLMAAATATHPPADQPAAFMARTALGVERRAAARQPKPRNARNKPAGRPETPAAEVPGQSPGSAPSMEALSQQLLPPAIREKLSAAAPDRVLILPVSDLGTVPWPALPLDKGMLVDLAPSVVLADIDWILLDPVPPDAGARAFVVGDPDLSGDKQWVFTAIPASREEASYVARRWDSEASAYTGAAADRASVLTRLKEGRYFSLLYFATHGISDAKNPMDGSFLALAGGHIYGRDIKDLILHGRPLVVMSACQTGLGKVFDSGVFGLARAWWRAGAHQVVMSLWNVDDMATRDLMTGFTARLKPDGGAAPEAPEAALRNAMLEARERNPDPALWAGFTVFGLPTLPERPRGH